MESGRFCAVAWGRAASLPSAAVGLLTLAERARLDRLLRAEDRQRSAAATVLLRLLACAVTGVRAHAIRIDRTCQRCLGNHGPPQLSLPGIEASVSHSGDLAGAAVSLAGPVGLDVEMVRPQRVRRVATHVLADDERVEDPSDLVRYWTRKEAVVKATTDGIGVGMSGVRVTPPSRAPELLSYPGRPDLRVQLHDLRAGPGHFASVAVLTDDRVEVTEQFVDW